MTLEVWATCAAGLHLCKPTSGTWAPRFHGAFWARAGRTGWKLVMSIFPCESSSGMSCAAASGASSAATSARRRPLRMAAKASFQAVMFVHGPEAVLWSNRSSQGSPVCAQVQAMCGNGL